MTDPIEPEPASFIWMDLFPADVTLAPDDFRQEVRVIVTDNHFYVLSDGGRGPAIAFKEALEEFDGNNKEGYTVSTKEGNTYTFSRSLGCGCGSRVRGIQPFAGVPWIARNLRK